MATVQQILDALDDYIEGANGLSTTCIKGYPDFRRPDISIPICALFYGGSQARAGSGRGGRVGASASAMVVTLGVYASDEVNLFSLAEKLHDLRKRQPVEITAGSGGSSQTVYLYVGDDEREMPDAEAPKELRHFITCGLVVVYE